jgi:2,4-dienoyl-CoA reductase-like NADH-dependent reductase (Old Yellow Enzyme family)
LSKLPREVTLDDIKRVQMDFVAATRRALEAGFEWLELHFGHGFLAQSFFSQHSNRREDMYGGSFDNRSRFLLETLAAVREVWPEKFPLTIRFGVIEFDGRDEETLEEATTLVRQFKAAGLDLLSVSMGFSTADAKIPWGPAFLAPLAARIRKETALPVAVGWGMGTPELAEQAVREEQADLVKIGSALLANPHWPFYAAAVLGLSRPSWVMPAQYAYWLERYSPVGR